jgi:hypothetical protein
MKALSHIAAVLVLAFAIPAFAHGNMDHIIGTVTTINGKIVTVEKDGVSTQVALVATTTWEANGKPGTQADLKVGDRVVIHATKINNVETAHDVRLAHPAK